MRFFPPAPFVSVHTGTSASPIHEHSSPEAAEHGEDKLFLLLPLAALRCHSAVLRCGLLTRSPQKPKISHPMIWLRVTERQKPSRRSRWRGQRKRCRCSATGSLSSFGFGHLPKFPSGTQLEGGKWQFLTPRISAPAEWNLSGARTRWLGSAAARGLSAHQTPRARCHPTVSIVEGKATGQFCEGKCSQSLEKMFIVHPPLIHARQVQKNWGH